MIIDAHSHCGVDMENYVKGDYPFCFDLNYFSQLLDIHGVDLAFTFPFPGCIYFDYPKSGEPTISGKDSAPYLHENALLLKQVEMYGHGKILPFVMVHPCHEVDLQKAFIEQNIGKIYGLKFHTTVARAGLGELESSGFFELARKYDLPIIVHSGDGEFSNPESMIEVIRKNQDIRFLIAHLADFNKYFFDFVKNEDMKNVFVDICPWYGLFEWNTKFGANKMVDFQNRPHTEVLKEIVRDYARFLVFGTDAPYTYELNEEYGYSVDSTYRQNLDLLHQIEDARDYSIVSHENALRFLGKRWSTS